MSRVVQMPPVIVGQTREAAFAAHDDRFGHAPVVREGRARFAAQVGRTYLVWGVVPSPLAVKVAENVLALYEGRGDPPNRVFYACYAGTHSSVLAASLHVGLLRDGRVCDLPFFDRRVSADIGVPLLIGTDRYGAEVYAVGTGWLSARLEKPLCDLIEVASPRARACICSVRGFLDLPARAGGFASRRCRLVWPGRALIASSLARRVPEMRKAVSRCLDLSRRWKDNEGQRKGEVIWVDGREAGRAGAGSPRGQPRGLPGN